MRLRGGLRVALVLALALALALGVDAAGEKERVHVPVGSFRMGSSAAAGGAGGGEGDGARPARRTQIKKPFAIDAWPVTNKEFARFVYHKEEEDGEGQNDSDDGEKTKKQFVTEAEKYQWSFVMQELCSKKTLKRADDGLGRVQGAEYWVAVEGADWEHPHGPDSAAEDDHPVVHVSWNDANAYCKWVGGKLPTEAEWEWVARSADESMHTPYAWGSEPDQSKCNTWQGAFPDKNSLEDGYLGLAPVRAYEPNALGVYDMVGNAWEWVAGGTQQERILRGGSFIDTQDGSVNHAAMVSTRMTNSADAGSVNIGFRCKYAASDEAMAESHGAARARQVDSVEHDEGDVVEL